MVGKKLASLIMYKVCGARNYALIKGLKNCNNRIFMSNHGQKENYNICFLLEYFLF